ncbi:hypothetical protein BU198_13065, partial [Streptomyces sp. CBMA156]|nr:hypothetical protein [Streptomyces sp. CBMA156]
GEPAAAEPARAPAPGAGRTPEQAAAHWQALQRGTDSGRAAVARAADSAGTPGDTTAGRDPGDQSTGPTPEGAEQ